MNEIVEVEAATFSMGFRAAKVRKITAKVVSLVERASVTSTSAIRSAFFLMSIKSNAPNNQTFNEGGLISAV